MCFYLRAMISGMRATDYLKQTAVTFYWSNCLK